MSSFSIIDYLREVSKTCKETDSHNDGVHQDAAILDPSDSNFKMNIPIGLSNDGSSQKTLIGMDRVEYLRDYDKVLYQHSTEVSEAPFEVDYSSTKTVDYRGEGANSTGLDAEYPKLTYKGQRKLGNEEIDHLARNLSSATEEAVVLYIGFAPSKPLNLVKLMFPNTRFICIDTSLANIKFALDMGEGMKMYNQFEIANIVKENIRNTVTYFSVNSFSNNERRKFGESNVFHYREGMKDKGSINRSSDKGSIDEVANYYKVNKPTFAIFEEYMTVDLLQYIVRMLDNYDGKLFIWSDIRRGDDVIKDIDVIIDNEMNTNWCRMIYEMRNRKPTFCSLKFRIPYKPHMDRFVNTNHWKEYLPQMQSNYLEGDIQLLKEGIYPSLAGKVYKQAWAAGHSTECRLHSSNDDILHVGKFSIDLHERLLSYYNRVDRRGTYYKNNNADRELGSDHCADCSIENNTIDRYLALPGAITGSAKDVMMWLDSHCGNTVLSARPHGVFF